MPDQYIHHGVMFSYYSAKTRAYLSYKQIPFVEQYVARELSGRIREVTNKVMIPVVETPDGEILQDTTAIIDALEARHPERPAFPEDPVLMLLTRIVEFFTDELWVSTAMNSRWNDPVSNAFAQSEFGRRIGGSMGLVGDEAMAIGARVAGQMQSYLPRLGVGDEAGQEAATTFFKEASTILNSAVGPTRYAFGPRPTLIDFCLLLAYYAHQYRDAGAAQQFLKTQTPDLAYYIDTLHAAQCAPTEGELELSDAFSNYLAFIGPSSAEFAAGIMSATADLAAEAEPGQVFEKAIEPISFKLGNADFSRGGSTFSAWKLQRVKDVYDGMNESDKTRANEVADAIGWQSLLATKQGYRLERVNHLTHLR